MKKLTEREPQTGWIVVAAGLIALTGGAIESAEPDSTAGRVVVVPAPKSEALCDAYALRVGGKDVPVYACRVSAVPFNRFMAGKLRYKRPKEQTEIAGFSYWEMTGPVRIEIESKRPIRDVVVRPLGLKIKPAVVGNRIAFDLDRPRQVVVEVNGMQRALHLFGNPPETDFPEKNAANVRYFGPGVHQTGKIILKDGQTVYLAAGAVVYGSIHATGAKNIRIAGRGIIDVAPFPRGKGGGAVRLTDCTGIRIDGIVMRDPDVWCCALFGCKNATITNVKLVGLWRYNADGIDICNSQDVAVSDSFIRSYDDALVVKGLKRPYGDALVIEDRPVRNVCFSRCTIWSGWGRAMEIGAETCAPEIAEVRFADCDIIRATHVAMDIQNGDRAVVRDIRFENIRVEMDALNLPPRMQKDDDETYKLKPGNYLPQLISIVIGKTNYSKDSLHGTVTKVLFKDIAVTAPRMPSSSFRGYDADHGVKSVTIENLTLNGKPVTDAVAAKLSIGKNVDSVKWK